MAAMVADVAIKKMKCLKCQKEKPLLVVSKSGAEFACLPCYINDNDVANLVDKGKLLKRITRASAGLKKVIGVI